MAIYKKYIFRKYSENYEKLFNKEKSKLKKILPKAKIEHVGSSSVRGLGGKGIIDIATSVSKSQIQNTIKKLEENGYNYRGGDKERHFFEKIIKHHGLERRAHIQLTFNDSKTWKSYLAVRDYLRSDKRLVKEYTRIKKEAIKYSKRDGKKYREYKKPFLEKLEKLALRNS